MRGSIQKRGKNTWRLVFDLERDNSSRRRQKVVTYRGTKRGAEKELSNLLSQLANGGFTEPHALSVAEYLKRWLNDAVKCRTSAKTWERYAEICNKHLSPALGAHRLVKLSPMHIQAYYAEALRNGRRDGKGGLSARTVLHHHRVFRQALQQALRWRLIRQNPADAVTAPKPQQREILALDQKQMAALLDRVKGTGLYIAVLLAVTTGLRRGEILGLRWCDVDLERGTLSVVQSLEETADGLRLKHPKTKRSRRAVSLPLITVEVLHEYKAEQAALRLQLGLGRDEMGMVCGRYDGSPRSPRAFSKEFGRFVSKSDLPHITFHSLRHSHATALLRAGVHPKVAQERLGHSTVATTLDLYSHVTKSLQDDAAQLVDAALRVAINERSKDER